MAEEKAVAQNTEGEVPDFAAMLDPIQFSDAAVDAVKGLLDEEKKKNPDVNLMLRIFVRASSTASSSWRRLRMTIPVS